MSKVRRISWIGCRPGSRSDGPVQQTEPFVLQGDRGYSKPDTTLLCIMGVASSFVSSMVLGLYINSTQAYSSYRAPNLLWGIVPLVLFWQCSMWLAALRGEMTDDPLLYASVDRTSIVVAIISVLIFLLATAGWVLAPSPR